MMVFSTQWQTVCLVAVTLYVTYVMCCTEVVVCLLWLFFDVTSDVCATLAQEKIITIPANVTSATYTGTLNSSATLVFEACSGTGPRALFRVELASQDRNITISTCDQGFGQYWTIMSVFSTGGEVHNHTSVCACSLELLSVVYWMGSNA